MGVGVAIELKRGGKVVTAPALANTGYETEEPEVHLPLALARDPNFELKELRGERYKVVGSEVITFPLGEVEVRAVAEGAGSKWVKARAVMVPDEYEVILSDSLVELLGIELVKPKSGLWRFTGETKLRVSAEAKYWLG